MVVEVVEVEVELELLLWGHSLQVEEDEPPRTRLVLVTWLGKPR